MAEPYIAQINMFGGNFAIRGWANCDGQLLSISNNSALFSILGTMYGGDGRTTFAVPDMRGRVPVHPGQGRGLTDYRQGPGGGAEQVNLSVANMPAHSHGVGCFDDDGNRSSPGGSLPANITNGYSAGNADGTMKAGMIQNTGGNTPFSIIQPWCGVRFLIALVGIFPSRN